jgi:hypothetical protein
MFPNLPEDTERLIFKKYFISEVLPLIRNKYRLKLKVEPELVVKVEQIINTLITQDTDTNDPVNRKKLDEMAMLLIGLHQDHLFNLINNF